MEAKQKPRGGKEREARKGEEGACMQEHAGLISEVDKNWSQGGKKKI